MYILELFEKRKREQAVAKLNSEDFRSGDTVSANLLSEAKNSKPFIGVCIRKSASTCLLRKSVGNGAVEFNFPLYSNYKFELIKSSKVRRARLYYLRDLEGKKARLKARYRKRES